MKSIKEHAAAVTYVSEDADPISVVVIDEDVYVSVWEMSWKERWKAFLNGRIYLAIKGGQPPVAMSVDDLIDTEKAGG